MFYRSVIELSLDSISQECEEATTSVSIISQNAQSIWTESCVLFVVMNLILNASCPFNVQGTEPYLCDVVTNERWPVSRRSRTSFFQTWYYDKTT